MLNGNEAAASAGTMAVARQQIEYLRRWYARATDLIGTSETAAVAEGRRIYHEIFAPDADIRTSGGTAEPFHAKGADAWVDVVLDALDEYNATQHLIGTQLVHIDSLQEQGGQITEGHATMTSYLQAWHSTEAGRLWLFIGTYEDEIRWSADKGWQIYAMNLVNVSNDHRQLGTE